MKWVFVTFLLLLNCLNGFSLVVDDCICGQMNPDYSIDDIANRIVNGTLVYPHKYPWMVAMQVYVKEQWIFLCGSSIISDKIILSAVHCMKDFDDLPYRFLTGMNVITTPESVITTPSLDQIYYAQAVINHPLYMEMNQIPLFDLAMIVVDRPITFSPLVSPICLPNPFDHRLFLHRKVKAAGWGNIDVLKPENPVKIRALMETELLLKTFEECILLTPRLEDNYDRIGVEEIGDNDAITCTLGDHTGTCAGDSGGPLFVNYGVNHHVILGVASFVQDECASGSPDFFGIVSDTITLNWIYNVIENAGGNVCRNPTTPLMRTIY